MSRISKWIRNKSQYVYEVCQIIGDASVVLGPIAWTIAIIIVCIFLIGLIFAILFYS